MNITDYLNLKNIKWFPVSMIIRDQMDYEVNVKRVSNEHEVCNYFRDKTSKELLDLQKEQSENIVIDTKEVFQIDVDDNKIDDYDFLKKGPYFRSITKKLPHYFVYINNLAQNLNKVSFDNESREPNETQEPNEIYQNNSNTLKKIDGGDILCGTWSYCLRNAIVYNHDVAIPKINYHNGLPINQLPIEICNIIYDMFDDNIITDASEICSDQIVYSKPFYTRFHDMNANIKWASYRHLKYLEKNGKFHKIHILKPIVIKSPIRTLFINNDGFRQQNLNHSSINIYLRDLPDNYSTKLRDIVDKIFKIYDNYLCSDFYLYASFNIDTLKLYKNEVLMTFHDKIAKLNYIHHKQGSIIYTYKGSCEFINYTKELWNVESIWF